MQRPIACLSPLELLMFGLARNRHCHNDSLNHCRLRHVGRPFFHWMLKKKLLMVPDGKSGSICFVNLGDFIVIREVVVALASRIRTFGFPDYLVRESDVHSSSSHSRLYC